MFPTVFVLLSSAAIAQQITGVVKDGQGKGIEMATVSLLTGKDSSVIKLAVTAVSGKYSFAAPGAGTYLISATHVGYSPACSAAFEVSGTREIS